MNRHASSLSPAYFDGLYTGETDPWGFETSPYERAKYEATLASLPQPRYRSALEIGCSIGILTHKLAQRCDALVSTDVVASALDTARGNCADQPHIRFELSVAPGEWPAGRFDLIMLSEVTFFFDRKDLERGADAERDHRHRVLAAHAHRIGDVLRALGEHHGGGRRHRERGLVAAVLLAHRHRGGTALGEARLQRIEQRLRDGALLHLGDEVREGGGGVHGRLSGLPKV